MKFLTFAGPQTAHLGVLTATDRIVDVTAGWSTSQSSPPRDVADLAVLGDAGLAQAQQIIARSTEPDLTLAGVKVLAPIPVPRRNIFCVGRNYRDHIDEGDRARGAAAQRPLPEVAEFFTKSPACVIGPGENVPLHSQATQCLDYEVELAIVIGEGGVDIPASRAMRHVFGYSIINDVTGRDLQRRHGQWFKGKSLDRSCPFGPVVVLKAAIGDAPPDLAIEMRVNGELRQSSRTSRMIFDIPAIIEQLSRGMALVPGDVIATGTPAGVGYAMDPPRYLRAGDRMDAHVENIGTLTTLVAEGERH